MKRNWDTIREILCKVEECTSPSDVVRLGDFPSEKAAEISYHMELLIEAGLVSGSVQKSMSVSVYTFLAYRLTWQGHEFLDAIRSDTVWNKTKGMFAENGISMTFDLVKDVAKVAAAGLLKLAAGG